MTVYEKYQTMTIEEMAKALSWEERFAVGFRKLDIMKLTNRNELNDIHKKVKDYRLLKSVGQKQCAVNGVKKTICFHRYTPRQQGAVVGSAIIKVLTN